MDAPPRLRAWFSAGRFLKSLIRLVSVHFFYVNIDAMRWSTKTTWIRITALFATYLALPAIALGVIRSLQAQDSGMAMFILMLFVALPLATIAIAVWDGAKEGFSLLWVLAPVICFLLPMYVFFNDSALTYGAIYSVLGLVANAIGALFHPRRTK